MQTVKLKSDWEIKPLSALGSFSKGSGVRKDEALSGSLPCIRYGEIYTRHNDYIRKFHSFVSEEVAATSRKLRKGDLLFAGSGETKEEIGKCVAFVDKFEAYAGGDIVILSPQNVDSLFLGYYLNTAPVNKEKASKGQGDAVVHISATALGEIEIAIPKEPKKQAAIAAILSDMDSEIEALESRLAKTRSIKQGMMQELLTGKTRLLAIESSADIVTSCNEHFNDAVVISVLADKFGSEQFPLGRKRYTKLSYLLRRHHKASVDNYLKKAAGPYNPKTKYGGAEKIAITNKYIKTHGSGKFEGFISDEKINEAKSYFVKWFGNEALKWLEQFRYKKK